MGNKKYLKQAMFERLHDEIWNRKYGNKLEEFSLEELEAEKDRRWKRDKLILGGIIIGSILLFLIYCLM